MMAGYGPERHSRFMLKLQLLSARLSVQTVTQLRSAVSACASGHSSTLTPKPRDDIGAAL